MPFMSPNLGAIQPQGFRASVPDFVQNYDALNQLWLSNFGGVQAPKSGGAGQFGANSAIPLGTLNPSLNPTPAPAWTEADEARRRQGILGEQEAVEQSNATANLRQQLLAAPGGDPLNYREGGANFPAYFGGGADGHRLGDSIAGARNVRALADIAISEPTMKPGVQSLAKDLNRLGAPIYQSLQDYKLPQGSGGAPGDTNSITNSAGMASSDFGPIGENAESYTDMIMSGLSFMASPLSFFAMKSGAVDSFAEAIGLKSPAEALFPEYTAQNAQMDALNALLGGPGGSFGGMSFGGMSGDPSLGGVMGADSLGAGTAGGDVGVGLGGLY